MLDAIPPGAWLTVVQTPYESLRVGSIILRVTIWEKPGIATVHRIIAKDRRGRGWVTKGDNLPRRDPGFVTAKDYLGEVVRIQPNGS